MKKWFLISGLITLIVIVLLAGCSGPAPSSSAPTSAAPSSAAPKTTAPASSAPASSAPASKPSTSAPTTSAPSSGGTIKIGHIRSLTGPTAITNKAMVQGFDLAMELAKYQVAGKTIEVKLEDDGGVANQSVDKARTLVEKDKVAVIVGPTLAGMQIAVATYMNQAAIPNLNSNTSPYAIIAQKLNWTLLCGGTPQQITSVSGKYVVEQRKIKKISVIGEDTAAGHDYVGGFLGGFKKAGGEVVQEQWSPQGSPDYGPYFTAVKPAEACVAWTSGNDSVKFLNQYYEFGMWNKMPLIPAFQGAIVESFILAQIQPKAADACLGMVTGAQYTPLFDNPTNKKFVDAYKAKYNIPPDLAAASAYNAGLVLLAGLDITKGDTTPQKLMDAMVNLNMETIWGNLRFDKQKKAAMMDVGVLKLQKEGPAYIFSTPIFTYKDVPPEGL
jgi:branched-chain amino acid transport system substrate-binding protein